MGSRRGTLARAIADADTLILPIDASASEEELEDQFGTFGNFLTRLEQSRGKRTDISGLPVFLVLTKCDLLAEPSDSFIDSVRSHRAIPLSTSRDIVRPDRKTLSGAVGPCHTNMSW